MIHNDKEYILTEGTEIPCEGCPLTDLCDSMADDLDMDDFELCAMEENYGEFNNPVYRTLL